jgi:hypothetical protein
MTQLQIQFPELLKQTTPATGSYQTPDEAFQTFHANNPQVFRALHSYARQLYDRGVKKFGINALFERLRWDYLVQTTGDAFKLNNNYAPYYARLLVEIDPDLDGFLERRASRADK